VGVREVVTAAGLDEGASVVVLADSTGHLRVLDISGGIDTTSEEAAAASFKQVRGYKMLPSPCMPQGVWTIITCLHAPWNFASLFGVESTVQR
jgi:hypothetical protein